MNILFVCTGNTCRSPMAEGYLKSLGKKGLKVKSRGLAANGLSASSNAVEVMNEIGLDISGHISKQLSKNDLEWAEKIICLSGSHKAYLEPYAKDKLLVLNGGISDPFGQSAAVYRECRDEIISSLDALLESGFFSKFSVKPIERQHIRQIAKLEEVCFSEPWSENGLLEAYCAGTKFFVAERGGKVLGYVGISCILDEGYITNVAVFPEERNRGVATAILEHIFRLAEEIRLSFVSLEVRQSNSGAIALYEKLGFLTEGRRKNFYTAPKEDALIMTKRFEWDENISD